MKSLSRLFALLGIMLASFATAQTGATCADAIPMTSDNCFNGVTTTDNEAWYSFTATSTTHIMSYTVTELGYSDFQTMTVYSGACASLTAFANGSLSPSNEHIIWMPLHGLSVGLTYFVKLERPAPGAGSNPNAKFNLCLTTTPPVLAYWGGCMTDQNGNITFCCYDADILGTDYMAHDCELVDTICPGDSIYLVHPITNQNYPMNDTFFGVWQFQGGSCAGTYIDTTFMSWACAYNTPGVYNIGLAYFWDDPNGPPLLLTGVKFQILVQAPPVANLVLNQTGYCVGDTVCLTSVGNGVHGLAFYVDGVQVQNCAFPPLFGCDSVVCFPDGNIGNPALAPGLHTASLVVTNQCGTDSVAVTFFINNPNPCFTYEATCRVRFYSDTSTCTQGIASHLWDFGDGFTAVGPNVTHIFALDGHTYLVTHFIVTTFGDTISCQLSVIQPGGPSSAITGAATNNCGSGVLSYTSDCETNVVYTWVASGGTGTVISNCQFHVSWSNAGGYIILTAFDTITDCVTKDTLNIPPCCDDTTALRIDNRTASSVLNDPAFFPYIIGTNFTAGLANITINGVFIIDTTFTFLNCFNINMGANAQIQVLANETFTLNNSRTQTACGYMWDGIYLNGVTSTVNIINNSNIQQARNTVVSISGGRYNVDNSTLRNNYKDIVVKAYSGTHPGTVRRTNFTMNQPFLPALFPSLPFGHTRTVCAIEIEDNADITIGDPTAAVMQNNFTDILVGVRSKNSRTNVFNCRFANFTPNLVQLFNVPDAGTGVVAIGQKNALYQPQITVGGALPRRCVFVNMRTAIDAREVLHVTVLNNNISDIRFYGVRVQRAVGRSININDNRITNQAVNYAFNTAILVLECYDATLNINLNRILQTADTTSAYARQTGTGIRVSCVSPADMTVSIQSNNSINRVRTGIWVQNLVGKNKVFIGGNVVNFAKPNAAYSTAHYGIRLEGCATVRCDTNRITKTGVINPISTMVQRLRGISIENSPVTYATDNVFLRLGSGLYGMDISSSSTLACNTMSRCYNGVFFDTCDIGDQIVDPNFIPSATGNTWIATQNASEDINGVVVPAIFWRYHTVTPPTSASATGITMQSVSYNACNFFFFSQAQFERDQQVGATLRSASDTNTSAENRYQLRRYAHRKLTQTPSWLNLGFPDDTLYQNFYNSYNPTNVGTLRQVELAADTGGYQFVASACSALACSNIIEHNAKVVYGIYAATWMQGIMEFSASDSATLLNIALQDPSNGGTAVYSARVMLDLEIDYYGASSQRLGHETSTPDTQSDLSVYPNPASESVKLEYGVDEGQNAQVEIFDLSGKLVLSQQLVPHQEVYTISTAVLPGGVYMLHVVVDGEVTEGQRLVIVK